MTPVLLDTHVLIWLVTTPDRLGRRALKIANDAQQRSALHVSAISFWEVAMLAQRGSIRLPGAPAKWRAEVLRLGAKECAVDGGVAIRSTELMGANPDPADRMILATGLELGATLVTADQRLLDWKGRLNRQDARR